MVRFSLVKLAVSDMRGEVTAYEAKRVEYGMALFALRRLEAKPQAGRGAGASLDKARASARDKEAAFAAASTRVSSKLVMLEAKRLVDYAERMVAHIDLGRETLVASEAGFAACAEHMVRVRELAGAAGSAAIAAIDNAQGGPGQGGGPSEAP